MNWEDEFWIKLYNRDTATWKLLDWRSRVVLMLMLRKCDRAGVIEVGDNGLPGLAAIVEVPFEVVESGMADLYRTKTVVATSTSYVIPKFMEAQETRQSDKVRKRESRERHRASQYVTSGHQRSPDVTNGHRASPMVTIRVEEKRIEENEEGLVSCSPSAPSKPSAPRGRKAKPKTTIPPGWIPAAVEAPPNVSQATELPKFRDHHAAKGSSFADWDAAWRNWLRRSAEFAVGRSASGQTNLERQLERVAMLERQEAEAAQ